MSGTSWTKSEIALLIKNYPNLSTKELQEGFIPQRTLNAIGGIAQRFNLRKTNNQRLKSLQKLIEASRKPRTWTREEDETLRQHYTNVPISKIVKLLPKHSLGAIRARANPMGLKRSKKFISQRMRVQVHKNKPWLGGKKRWTDEEIRTLRRYFSKMSIIDLMKLLPRHSRSGIGSNAHNLGLGKSKEYLETLRKKQIERARGGIEEKGRKYPNLRWSDQEKKILRTMYFTASRTEILKKLNGKTWNAVRGKALRLGLKRDLSNAIKMSLNERGVNPASWTHKKPTKPERKLGNIIKKNKFPFRYVGDGSVCIGSLNPDFIETNGRKKVIEVFGKAFHNPETSFVSVHDCQTEEGRKAAFAKRGFDCLIIWDDELNDEEEIVKGINRFVAK